MRIKNFIVAASVLLAALGFGVAGAQLLTSPEPPSSNTPFDEIAQSAEATSNGISVTALGASFSGTETLLRLKVIVEDQAAAQAAIGSDAPIQQLVPAPTGFSGPFAEGTLTSSRNSVGEVIVHLPAIERPVDYNGTLNLAFTQFAAIVPSGRGDITGTWTLPLRGHDPAVIDEKLRVESLAGETVEVGGQPVTTSGRRSASATLISYTIPNGTKVLTGAILTSGGVRSAARSSSAEGNVATTVFAATPFGSEVSMELGAIGQISDGTTTLKVQLARALERAGEAKEFTFEPTEVSGDDPTLVLKGIQGEQPRFRFAGITVSGNWHPSDDAPVILDARGAQLQRSHVDVGYTKDVNGTVQAGSTTMGFMRNGDMDLSEVTFILGGKVHTPAS